jgi:hypothetical protein
MSLIQYQSEEQPKEYMIRTYDPKLTRKEKKLQESINKVYNHKQKTMQAHITHMELEKREVEKMPYAVRPLYKKERDARMKVFVEKSKEDINDKLKPKYSRAAPLYNANIVISLDEGLNEVSQIRQMLYLLKQDANATVNSEKFNFPKAFYNANIIEIMYYHVRFCNEEKESIYRSEFWSEHQESYPKISSTTSLERLFHYIMFTKQHLIDDPKYIDLYKKTYLTKSTEIEAERESEPKPQSEPKPAQVLIASPIRMPSPKNILSNQTAVTKGDSNRNPIIIDDNNNDDDDNDNDNDDDHDDDNDIAKNARLDSRLGITNNGNLLSYRFKAIFPEIVKPRTFRLSDGKVASLSTQKEYVHTPRQNRIDLTTRYVNPLKRDLPNDSDDSD